ncbi:hypothetical protein I7I53_11059 [Histoplasma capsulatum var. duboisii H88]|uniref:Uncharacterized protein n=1 Tax=Ajellomyces capsulatus (strain H88) TaxID=544711 RepID=A0A8A1LF32_AJEC8|nr:hypothetical protein I7I53_11059 [Histoplasma capsulatum var. duboisii H88]
MHKRSEQITTMVDPILGLHQRSGRPPLHIPYANLQNKQGPPWAGKGVRIMVIPGWVPSQRAHNVCMCMDGGGGVCGQKAIPSHYSNFRCIPSFELRDPAMILAGGKLPSYKGPRDCWPHFPLPGSGVRVNYEMKQSSLVRDMES